MKKVILLMSLFATSAATAKTVNSIPEKKALTTIASVSQVISIEEKNDISVRAVEHFHGLGTDMSPTHSVSIVFYHAGEMNNSKTAFSLGFSYGLMGFSKVAQHIYMATVRDFSAPNGFGERQILLDMNQVFYDDQKLKSDDFEDPYFLSSIEAEIQ